MLFALPFVPLLAAMGFAWNSKKHQAGKTRIAIASTALSSVLFILLCVQCYSLESKTSSGVETSVAWLSGGAEASGPNVRWGYRFDVTNSGFIFVVLFSLGILGFRYLRSNQTLKLILLCSLQFTLISSLMAYDLLQFCICSELSVILFFLLLNDRENSESQSRPLVLLQFLACNFLLAGCLGLVVLMATFNAGATESLSLQSFSINALTNGIPESIFKNGLSELIWNQVAPFLCFLILGGCLIRTGIFPLHHWLETLWKKPSLDSLQLFLSTMTVLGFYTWFRIGKPLFETEFNLLSNLILWLGAIGYFWCALISSNGSLERKLSFIAFGNTSLGWIGLAAQNEIGDWGVTVLVLSQALLLSLITLFRDRKFSEAWAQWFLLIGLLPAKITVFYGLLYSNPSTTNSICLMILLGEALFLWLAFQGEESESLVLELND